MTRLSPAASGLVFCFVALSMVAGVAGERFASAAALAATRPPNPTADKTKKSARPAKPTSAAKSPNKSASKTTNKKKAAVAATAKSAGGKTKGKVKGSPPAHARVEKAPPPPMVGGRVAVFAFKGEETAAPVRTEVVNLLRSKGLNVMTTLLPVDSSDQYRDMAATLGLAVYVHGEVRDDGEHARAVVHIRSGVSGRKIKSARFSGPSRDLPADVGQSLWGEVGPSFLRACAQAAKPRKGARAPLRIEAGTPIEPSDTAEGT